MNKENILSALVSRTIHEGATQASIADLEQWVSKPLPAAYVELMSRSNGVEGFLGGNSYLVLWPVEQLKELNEAYSVAEFAPGLLLIGSDGGGTRYAFDIRHEPMSVIEVPFIRMSHDEAKTVASSFDGFIESKQRGREPF